MIYKQDRDKVINMLEIDYPIGKSDSLVNCYMIFNHIKYWNQIRIDNIYKDLVNKENCSEVSNHIKQCKEC